MYSCNGPRYKTDSVITRSIVAPKMLADMGNIVELHILYIYEYLDLYINNMNTNLLGYEANHLRLSKCRPVKLSFTIFSGM